LIISIVAVVIIVVIIGVVIIAGPLIILRHCLFTGGFLRSRLFRCLLLGYLLLRSLRLTRRLRGLLLRSLLLWLLWLLFGLLLRRRLLGSRRP